MYNTTKLFKNRFVAIIYVEKAQKCVEEKGYGYDDQKRRIGRAEKYI